ncbi:HYDIN protein, partial [Mohoua ochrocephala]|nr:HYDIN protein [Mohoua ochrocephala]
SDRLEATVVVKNPCKFPIEFYSLDFDEQYLVEEELLRMAVGSKSSKTILMPPRAVGETLPPEVLEDCEAQKKLKAHQAELKAQQAELKAQQAELKAKAEAKAKVMGTAPGQKNTYQRTVTFYPEPLVKVLGNPISRAIMRLRGVDPSLERQRKGIVVIVHGAPRSGKSEIAANLCYHYDAEYLSLDAVVKEAIAND